MVGRIDARLAEFGIELPDHDMQIAAKKEFEEIRSNLGTRKIADLIHLPMMSDQEHQEIVKLLMNLDTGSGKSIEHLEQLSTQIPENPILMNSIAWTMFKTGQLPFIEHSLQWANKAVSMSTYNKGMYQHTLASIQCALDKIDNALKSAGEYLMDMKTIQSTTDDATELFIELSARGEAKRALQLLIESPAAKELEPLAIGIRLFLGENVKIAAEITEIGYDVAKRISQRQEELEM